MHTSFRYAHRAALSAMHPYHRTRCLPPLLLPNPSPTCSLPHPRGGGASAVKTLDLLRTVLQPSLNLKIKNVCDDYLKVWEVGMGRRCVHISVVTEGVCMSVW